MKKLVSYLAIIGIAFLLVGFTDPTKPPVVVVAPKAVTINQPLALKAIFIYPKDRFAIINNQIVRSGDKIGEFTITTISPDTVELVGPQNATQVLPIAVPVVQNSQERDR